MRILILSRWLPYPPDNGSRLRIWQLLRHLGGQHELELISFVERPPDATQLEALRGRCARVRTIPYTPFRPTGLRSLAGFASLKPRSFIGSYSPLMAAAVGEAAARQFDLVLATEIDMAPYAALLPGSARLLDDLELAAFVEHARHPRGRLTWWKLAHFLRSLLRRFDACTVVSRHEQALVCALAPRDMPVVLVPNGVDVDACAGERASPKPGSLIYAGSLTYGANFDAVAYFLEAIFPRIRAARPATVLTVTGSTAGAPLERLPPRDGVLLTGQIPHVRPAIAQSWVSVVPLRQGSGTRLKILESLALGTPVVSTSKGAEGLELVPGRDLLIADDPADFAQATLRLLDDAGLRATLAAEGGRSVAASYNWPVIGRQLDAALELALSHRSQSRSATARG